MALGRRYLVKQLEKKLPIHQTMLETLSTNLEKYENSSDKGPGLDFNYSMALLTSAAWDSARMTQSVQFMSFDEVSEFSKIYRFQSVYVENQQKLIEKIMKIGDIEDDNFGRFTKGFIHRLRLLIEINQMLSGAYKNFKPNENTSQSAKS
ncbi:MAG: hypothetical protein OQJ89_02145 [Kangiellaceae bacterium]|nr:hypothetical protein [Kangiellaceae bacterium]